MQRVARLEALFDEHGVRAIEPRPADAADAAAADAVITALNDASDELATLGAVRLRDASRPTRATSAPRRC